MQPAQYPHESESEPQYPPLEYLQEAVTGDEFLIRENSGRCFRGLVIQTEPWVVCVTCRTEPGPAIVRAFAMNGFELGATYPAELIQMPPEKADRYRRREALFQLIEQINLHGEDAATLEEFQRFAWDMSRNGRRRAIEETRRRRELDELYERRPNGTIKVTFATGSFNFRDRRIQKQLPEG